MRAARVKLRGLGGAWLGSLPRDGMSWAAIAVLGIGMMVLGVSVAAERGITRTAVAPEHQQLRIVGRSPIDQFAGGAEPAPMSLVDYAAWRDEPGLENLVLFERAEAIVVVEDAVRRISLWRVTAELPGILGLDPPITGRLPRARGEAGAIELALSAGIAREWFGNADAALDQRLLVEGMPGRVVGVLRDPAGDAFAGIDAWTMFDPESLLDTVFAANPEDPFFTTPYLVGVVDGGSEVSARRGAAGGAESPVIAPLARVVLGPRIPVALRIAMIAAGLLFVGSLVSAAMLLVGALLVRREEFALRLAMGSTRGGLMLGLIAHAVMLSILATGGAMLCVWWLTDLTRGALLGTLPGARGIAIGSLDPAEWIVVTLLGALLLGASTPIVAWPIRPAWCVRGLPGVRRARSNRIDDAGVAMHAALATAAVGLVVSLGSLASRAVGSPDGLDVERVGVMTITLPWWRIEDDNAQWRIVRDTLESVERLGLFEALAAADNAPLAGPDFRAITVNVPDDGGSGFEPTGSVIARLRTATPGATELLGIDERRRLTEQAATTLLRLYEADLPPLPATISDSLAVALFGSEDSALGQPIELGDLRIPALVLTIVDQAADGPIAFDEGGPSIWLPMPIGWESPTWSLLVKMPADDNEVLRAKAEERLRDAVRSAVADAAVDPVVWLDQRVAERARIYTASAAISSVAAVAALLLAMLACVGRTRLAVASRLDELRLRSAFGQPMLVLAGRAALPGCCGAAIGIVVAVFAWAAFGLGDALSVAESVLAVGVGPALGVFIACAGACLLAARLARVDAEALLHAL